MRKRAISNETLFVIMSQISQVFSLILMRIYQHKSLLLSKGMSDFKTDYTTVKSSMCRFQKCKKINFEKWLLVVVTSTFFSTYGLNYTKMCGKARGYQFGTIDAFQVGSNILLSCSVGIIGKIVFHCYPPDILVINIQVVYIIIFIYSNAHLRYYIIMTWQP